MSTSRLPRALIGKRGRCGHAHEQQSECGLKPLISPTKSLSKPLLMMAMKMLNAMPARANAI